MLAACTGRHGNRVAGLRPTNGYWTRTRPTQVNYLHTARKRHRDVIRNYSTFQQGRTKRILFQFSVLISSSALFRLFVRFVQVGRGRNKS